MTGKRIRLFYASLLATALLAGCAAPPQTSQAPVGDTTLSAEQLLSRAADAQPIKAAELRLQAAELLQQRGDFSAAASALAGIDTGILPPNLAFDIARVRAGSAINLNDSNRALQFLDLAQFPELDTLQQAQFSRLRAQAYDQQANPLAAALELISVAKTAPTDERPQLHDLIWRQLLKVDAEPLVAASLSNYGYYEQGWVELALSLAEKGDLSTQRDALTKWQQLWDAHPANKEPPRALAALLNADLLSPRRILVALPFSGSLAQPARIISEGINAALYQRKALNLPIPELISIDTEQLNNAADLLNIANQQRAELIIGPLKGSLIDELAMVNPLPMPIIVFNQSASQNANLYQIDLSTDQEANQVVTRAMAEGHRRFALITPAASWGQRIRSDFEKAILENQAEVQASLEYQSDADLSEQIANLLNTQKSQARFSQIRQTIGQKIEFNERPRRDIDAILITATSQEARQIKPMLSFHFAGNYPVYATSHLFEGDVNPVRDIDLNSVQFLDTPWLLKPGTGLNLEISAERKDTQSRIGRLYALGADAFNLHPFLRQLEGSDEIYFDGLTGRLTLGADKRVRRELVWAIIDQGVPVLLGPPQPVLDTSATGELQEIEPQTEPQAQPR